MGGQPSTAHEYASAIMWRGRVPMDPADFTPNWNDRPRKEKFYRGARRIPLPDSVYPATGRLEEGVHGSPDAEPFDLQALSGMLQDSYGLTGRRLGVHANNDLDALPHYVKANWSRGTASGGGLYPTAIYWVSGPSGPFGAGIHLYSTKHHAVQRIAVGDYTDVVRRSLGPGVGQDTDQFLVLGIKYWQNAFKYNSFSYHATSMDIGTVLQSWRLWANGTGRRVKAALWFDEQPLADALGLPADSEGLFAVVPLPWAGAPAPSAGAPSDVNRGQVRRVEDERSVRLIEFPANRMMHRRALAESGNRPAVRDLDAAAAAPVRDRDAVTLPPRPVLDVDVRTALRTRRSSFGRFDATHPLEQEPFGALLAAAAATTLDLDVVDADTPSLLKIYACVNHVDGVTPGVYEYDPTGHRLVVVDGADPGQFVQDNYFLANYNLEQAAAVLVPTMRTAAVLDAAGDRAYRVVNATIGAVSQSVYTASAALDVGCGVALGFDNISFAERFGVADTDEAALLIMAVGHERPGTADFRYQLGLVRTTDRPEDF